MKKALNMVMTALLLAGFMAACSKEGPAVTTGDDVVTRGPVTVSLDICVNSLSGLGQTKALFDGDLDGTAAENKIDDFALYLFDASDAYNKTEGGVQVFDPTKAKQLLSAPVTSLDGRMVGTIYRTEFTLTKTVKSLAVLMLANLGSSNYKSIGSATTTSMADVVDYLSDRNNLASIGIDYVPSADYGKTKGIPMYGWKLFGDMGGSAAVDQTKALKFFKGMSTPLTKTGFTSAAEVEAYASRGFVSDDDVLALNRSLARIRFRYDPAPGAHSVTINYVKLFCYRDHIAPLPLYFFEADPRTPFDPVTDWGTAQKVDVDFKLIDGVLTLYVPEFNVNSAKNQSFEPYLKVQIKDNTDDVLYTFTPTTITVVDALHGSVSYPAQGKTSWLHFRSMSDKTIPGGGTVVAGTYFNIVRNYTYEWVATGITQ